MLLLVLTLISQRFEELVKLSKLHGQVLVTAIFKPRTTSRLYNLLPTAEKKILDNYLTQWASFNSTVIKDAREVRSRTQALCPTAN